MRAATSAARSASCLTRGPERYRPAREIVDEVARLVGAAVAK
jgi:hypothetical protein